MGGWFFDYLLDPDVHSARPATGDVRQGTLFPCETHNMIEKNTAAGWIDWAAINPTGGQEEAFMVAASDEVTALVAGAAQMTFRMPYAFTLTKVKASLTAASASGGPVTVDINESGASILSTKLTIDDTEETSKTAATPAVISDPNLAEDAEITIDIDDEGTGAKGLKVYLIGTRA